MCFSTPNVPEVKEASMPKTNEQSASLAAEEERKKRLRAKGVSNSIITSPQGLAGSAPTTNKQLLGQ